MTNITLTCTGASVQADVCGELTSGMAGIEVNIDFDTAWDGLTPTFYAGNATDKAIPMAVNADGMTSIPPEVMISGKELLIGARGVNAAGDIVLPTRWACCGMIDPSPDDAEKVTPKPPVTPDIVDQIKAQAYTASVDATVAKEAAEGAQLSAGESAASAAESAEAANRAAGEASGAKREAASATQKAAEAGEKADTALSIASGASRAFTAETFQELQAWLRAPANAGKLMRGDNLYIVALDTPDYWVVSPLPSADPDTGYWYRIAPLETSKVDLSGYAKLSQLSAVATSGDYNDLHNKPTIPPDQSKKIEDLEKASDELKEGLTQVEQLLPEAAPVAGKVLKVLAVNPDGTFTCEWADGGSGGVTDVQVKGTSIVTDGVATIPVAVRTETGPALQEVRYKYGLEYSQNMLSVISAAKSDSGIRGRKDIGINWYGLIDTSNYDYAVKAAMCDPVGSTSKNPAWTPEEQAAARGRLGAASRLKEIRMVLDEPAEIMTIAIPDDAEEIYWYSHTYHDSSGDNKENGRQTSVAYTLRPTYPERQSGYCIYSGYQAKTVDQVFIYGTLVKRNGVWNHYGMLALGGIAGPNNVLNNTVTSQASYNGGRIPESDSLELYFAGYAFDAKSEIMILYR